MRVRVIVGVGIDGGGEAVRGTKVTDERNQVCTAVGDEYGRRASEKRDKRRQKKQGQGLSDKSAKEVRSTRVHRNIASNCRLPASCSSSDSPIPRVVHELSLGLVRRALFRVRVHDAREPCRQSWPIRPLPRRIRSLDCWMRIHELELLIPLHGWRV